MMDDNDIRAKEKPPERVNVFNYVRLASILLLLIGSLAATYNSTGGTMTYDGLYTVVTYTSNGTFNVTGEISNATVLVVAGGGAGSCFGGGGGGAGGLIYNTSYNATGDINVTIGAGGNRVGACAGATLGKNGSNSSFGSLVAEGGGAGGAQNIGGRNGGSGGGAGYTGGAGGTPTAGQGNNGGSFEASINTASGGGGASTNGTNGTDGGTGGNGTAYDINGTSVYYAGGGGGAAGISLPAGGNGGGGAGGRDTPSTNGTPGTNGTGGGGGGSWTNSNSGSGGSGIVIVRYLTYTPPPIIYANLTVICGTGAATCTGNATDIDTSTGATSPITTSAATNYTFSLWTITTGNCTLASATSASTNAVFTNTTSNCDVTASFNYTPPATVTVSYKTYSIPNVTGVGGGFDYAQTAMETATGSSDAFGLMLLSTIWICFYIIGSRYTQERALVFSTFMCVIVAFLMVSGDFLDPKWLILLIIALLAAVYLANRVG